MELRPHLCTVKIPREAIFASVEAALRASSDVGLFRTGAVSQQQLELPE